MWKHEALASAREPHLFQRETEDRVASARNKQQRKKKKGETGRSEFLNLKGYLFILKNGKIGGPDCGSWVVESILQTPDNCTNNTSILVMALVTQKRSGSDLRW